MDQVKDLNFVKEEWLIIKALKNAKCYHSMVIPQKVGVGCSIFGSFVKNMQTVTPPLPSPAGVFRIPPAEGRSLESFHENSGHIASIAVGYQCSFIFQVNWPQLMSEDEGNLF